MQSPPTTARYRALIEQLGDEEGRTHGWKRRVAERLRVHPSYVSRILGGSSSNVGQDVIDRACEALGIHPSFFSEDFDDPPHYRQFVSIGHAPSEPWPRDDEAWARVMEALIVLLVAAFDAEAGLSLEQAAEELATATAQLAIPRTLDELRDALRRGDREAIRGSALRLADAIRTARALGVGSQ